MHRQQLGQSNRRKRRRIELTISLNFRTFNADGITAPLRDVTFSGWLAFSPIATLVRSVGVAWAMTQMTWSADQVVLVQIALMLPVMLISMPRRDRRHARPTYRDAGLSRTRARRRDRIEGTRLGRLDDAEYVARIVFRGRQRRGVDRPGLAVLGSVSKCRWKRFRRQWP